MRSENEQNPTATRDHVSGFPTLNRRAMLLGTVIGPVLAAACSPGGGIGNTTTASTTTTTTTPPPPGDLVDHLLRRATFGPTVESRIELDALGRSAWLDRQLDPSSIDDSAVEAMLSALPSISMTAFELRDNYESTRGRILQEATMARLLRATHSNRQLHEVMVGFWSDHFNVDASNVPEIYLKGVEEREVMRANALGRFEDLLLADVSSPAMLVYLNNATSRADGDNVPNENHARELMELHTVGVNGGYDERDVEEIAHLLSGWTVDRDTAQMTFRTPWHSMGDFEEVLGWTSGSETGQAAGESFVRHLAHHASTASFLATKLCTHFVSDSPPQSLIDSTAGVYLDNDTRIAPVMRHILLSGEFDESIGQKVRRPFELLAAQARAQGVALSVQPDGLPMRQLLSALSAMGEPPYQWPTPDGPPDVGPPWLNSGLMLQRWNTSLALTQRDLPGVEFDPVTITPQDSETAGELIEDLARILGLQTDEASFNACLEIIGATSDMPVTPAMFESVADLAAILFVSPSAQRR